MTRTTPSTTDGAVQLDHAGDRSVVVTPPDFDRFVLSEESAAEACVREAQLNSFKKHMNERIAHLFGEVRQWSTAHPQVARAVLCRRERDRHRLVLVLVSNQLDPAFDDEVAELDLRLIQNYPEFPVFVMTVPQSVYNVVESEHETFEVYGNASRASSGG